MTTEQRAFARTLRRRQTLPEEMLWNQLRGRRLAGSKWRRQVPLGPYTADFLCLSTKLIVELDGRHHDEQPIYDGERSRELEAMGFALLRFTNEHVENRLSNVLDRISAALRP